MKNYSKIVAPLTCLTYKDKLEWSTKANQAFQDLKKAFTIAPILIHLNFQKLFFLESHAFDFALEAIFSQHSEDGSLHPRALHLQKFTTMEINYEIYDEELLAIIYLFQEW